MRYLPLVLVCAVALAACPTKRNTLYCASVNDCSGATPSCDTVKHECQGASADMALPLDGGIDMTMIACNTSADCTSASVPSCQMSVCGSCTSGNNADCAMYHATTPLCGPAGGCVECLANGDCSSKTATPYCGPSNACVECLSSTDCAPKVCAANACHACQKNSECLTGVCNDATGNCVDSSMIYLVDNGGMTVSACSTTRVTQNGNTALTAYCDISGAPTSRPYVLVTGHGAAFPYTPFGIGTAQTFVGPGGTAAMPAVIKGTATGAIVKITNATGTVTLDGLEIDGGNSIDAVSCAGPNVATHNALVVKNAYIHNGNSNGIVPTYCDVTVQDSRISQSQIRHIDDSGSGNPSPFLITTLRSRFDGSQADGVYITGILNMDRCIVDNNAGGSGNGLQLWNPHFTVTNSFFYLNDTAVDFTFAAGSAQSVFMFNTLVHNTTRGLSCTTGVPIQASIYVLNGDGALTTAFGCIPQGVVTDTSPDPPVFKDGTNAATYDFHLAVDTTPHINANKNCCIDKIGSPLDGGTSPLPTHDYDGDARPKGTAADVGADEAM